MAGVYLRKLERLFAQYGSKVEGCLELHFFRPSQRAAGEIFRKGLTKSRRQSEVALFRVIAAGLLGSLAIGGKRQPEVVWPERLFRAQFRRLVGLFAGNRPKAEGCPELLFFGLSQRVAGEIFRKGLTKSRRQSDLNIFSRYISGHWRGFLQGIDQKPKAVWSYSFSGYRNGPLGEPRGRWEKAAGGSPA